MIFLELIGGNFTLYIRCYVNDAFLHFPDLEWCYWLEQKCMLILPAFGCYSHDFEYNVREKSVGTELRQVTLQFLIFCLSSLALNKYQE
jgi:hypothetical protein